MNKAKKGMNGSFRYLQINRYMVLYKKNKSEEVSMKQEVALPLEIRDEYEPFAIEDKPMPIDSEIESTGVIDLLLTILKRLLDL